MSSLSLVFLHGWGGDSRVWQPLCERLGERLEMPLVAFDLPGFGARCDESWPEDGALLDDLAGRLPARCVLVGHSLGGMLALRLAGREQRAGTGKVRGLVTIGANGSFVQRGAWPGMAPAVFAGFCREFGAAPAATREKFCGLQARGDKAMRVVMKQLKQWSPASMDTGWQGALAALGRWDIRSLLADPGVPALHLFGAGDALVPVAAVESFRGLGARSEIIEGAGHAPQVSRPGPVAERIGEFLRTIDGGPGDTAGDISPDSTPFAKTAVARSFGRAAASYDTAAHLQRAVCRQLLGTLDDGFAPRRILDLGSGTGYGSELLRRRFPEAEIVAADLAEGMLRYARTRRPAADSYVVGDAEQLPLASGSFDLVFSSMALQWCYRLPRLFRELRRVLASDGRCLVTTLGPRTLAQLRESWALVDGGVHVNSFLPAADWLAAAGEAGLSASLQAEERVLHFDSVVQLMRELKSIGAHNINRAAGKGLTGRARLRSLAGAYERLRTPAGLPASYELLYLDLRSAGCGSAGHRESELSGAGIDGLGTEREGEHDAGPGAGAKRVV